MIGQISAIANDLSIKTNIVQAATMLVLQPLLGGYRLSVRHGKNNNGYIKALTPVAYTPLPQRLSRLEVRQTLLEADFTLLRGQLEPERVGTV